MTDPTPFASSARRISDFANDAARAAAGVSPWTELARSWVNRARLAGRWPQVRGLMVGTPGPGRAEAAEKARHAARVCRELAHTSGLGRIVGMLRRSGRSTESQLDEVAHVLDEVTDRLGDAPPGGELVVELDTLMASWSREDHAIPARLLSLQQGIREYDPALEGLLDRLGQADPWPGQQRSFEARALPEAEAARAAVGIVQAVVEDVAERAADLEVWEVVALWTSAWLLLFHLDGEVGLLLDDDPAGPGQDQASVAVPIRQRPGRSAVFRLQIARSIPGPADSPWTKWAQLPEPPLLAGRACPPLDSWLGEISEAVAAAGYRGPAPSTTGAMREFQEWLATDDGRSWFNDCLQEAEARPGPARSWWRVLRSELWCRAFPDLDTDTEPPRPIWPDEPPGSWPSITSRAAPEPLGQVIEVMNYAPEASAARLVISDGPEVPDSPLARFHQLSREVGPSATCWADGLWDRVRALSIDGPAGPDEPAALVNRLLDVLEPEANQPSGPTFEALRLWAESFGLTLRPHDGSASDGAPGVIARFGFDGQAGGQARPPGSILTAGDRVFRSSEVWISLGEAPAGLIDLEEMARRLPAGSERLGSGVEGLRQAIHGDYLGEALIELYIDFWGDGGEPARKLDPALAAEFSERLNEMLLTRLGFSPFQPRSVYDFESNWMVFVAGGRPVTGMIRRVHRPGLRDRFNNLRIPALVEVE